MSFLRAPSPPHGPEYPDKAALPPFQMRAQPVPALSLVQKITYHRTLFP